MSTSGIPIYSRPSQTFVNPADYRRSPRIFSPSIYAGMSRVLAVVAVLMAVLLAGTRTAFAAGAELIADQPGVTAPAQPGTGAPPPPPPPLVYPEQPVSVRNGPAPRPAPSPAPAPPVRVQDLHLPRPVPAVAPIKPPPNTIRIGQFQTPSPGWLPPQVRDTINGASATAEAQVSTALDSVGLPPGRSDRVAGATLAGAGAGGAIGGALTGAPGAAAGAVVGGLIGGTIGGIAGAAIGTVVAIPVIGTVTSGVLGTAAGAAIGAGIGAAIAGIPTAAVGAVIGGTIGAGFGTGVGVGQR
jgi:hypothetical protein